MNAVRQCAGSTNTSHTPNASRMMRDRPEGVEVDRDQRVEAALAGTPRRGRCAGGSEWRSSFIVRTRAGVASMASCVAASTVRRSRTTRSCSMRAITGGSSERSQRSVASGESPSLAIDSSTVGSCRPGALPPPTADDPLDHRDAPAVAGQRFGERLRARFDVVRRHVQHPLHRDGRRARGRRRIPASVASSIANVILSARSARISGCVRSRSTSALRPAMMPHCGPPSSLSPLKQTRSTPAAIDACTDGSSGEIVGQAAAADVFDDRHASSRAPAATRSLSDGRSVKPSMRKFDGCTRRNIAVAGDTDAV